MKIIQLGKIITKMKPIFKWLWLNIQSIAAIVAIFVAIIALLSDNESTKKITDRLDDIGKVWKDNIEQEKKLGIPRLQLDKVYFDGKSFNISLINIGKRPAITLNGYAGYLYKERHHLIKFGSTKLLKGNPLGPNTEQTLTGKMSAIKQLNVNEINVLVKIPYVDMDFGDTLIFKQLVLLKVNEGFILYSNDSIESIIEEFHDKINLYDN